MTVEDLLKTIALAATLGLAGYFYLFLAWQLLKAVFL